ncbi:sensor histidine kinase [Paenibacillus alkalitolerans]|uniref:sensor histidine kinase n=1 Tax=Paenibacillus alkalitolerans TaxID=2799335 RepID=UPI0018F549CE|nr:sensor histidine kinase [Paenibacillus alkalitolerans]
MRRGIKAKIIFSAALIITVALLVSGIFTGGYFRNILKIQVMKDEAIKIRQASGQIRYIQDDIRQLAQYIIVDGDIQLRINSLYSEDLYERLSSEDWLSTKLKNYLLLKDYIDSVVLVAKDGKVISSNPLFNSYYSSSLEEDWHTNFINRNVFSGFSERHVWKPGQAKINAVSYIINYNPDLNPRSKLHHLIVHINLDYLMRAMPADLTDYDAVYLLDANNRPLLSAGEIGKESVPIEPLLERAGSGSAYEEETNEQIVHVNQAMFDHWKLITFKSKRDVLKKIDFVYYFFTVSTMASILLIMLTLTPVIANITRPILRLTNAMKQAAMGKLDTVVSIRSGDEIELLGNGFNRMLQDIRKYIDQSIEDENIKRRLQIDLLLSQINPHFIYNTLNTVIYMAREQGNHDIVKMMESFIRLLQDTVTVAKDGYFATVREEISHVRDYLTIQNYRYPERFAVDWRVDEQVWEERIPKTLLQPLVENALFHGIIPNPEQGTISISLLRADQRLQIKIADNGVGMDAALIEKFGRGDEISDPGSGMRPIGLANVRDRIRSYYGSLSDIRIDSEIGKGTLVSIEIPLSAPGFYTK